MRGKMKIKDVIFCAITAAVMLAVSFILVPMVTALPIPGIRGLVPAFFFGFLMVIAYIKVGKPWMTTLIGFLMGAVLLMMSVVMFLNCVVSGLITDLIAVLVFKNGYSKEKVRPVLAGVYISLQCILGVFFSFFVVGNDAKDIFFQKPIIGIIVTLVTFALGYVGGAAGNKVGKELKNAGVVKN